MKKILFIVLVFFVSQLGYSELKIKFPDLNKPNRIMVDNDRLYVVETPHIFIYSLEDNRLIKKFGRAGEGPQEFMGNINLLPYPDHIIVNSRGKITYWSKNGDFIKEVKCPFSGGVEPCEDTFVGSGQKRGNAKKPISYQTIDVYDSKFNKLREVDRKETPFQPNRGLLFYSQPYYFYIQDNKKIVVMGHDGLVLNVFDKNGKKLYTIHQDVERKKVSEADRQKVRKYFLNHPNPQIRAIYPANKHMLKFADYFPAILGFQAFDQYLYVWTYELKNGKTEFYIFDSLGKLVKKVYLPLQRINIERFYPFFICNNTFYHLVENEEDEVWELHTFPINI